MIKILNTEHLKKSIEQIATFIDECNIHINDEGLFIRAFDNAQMLYVEYSLSSKGLEGALDSLVFGINISEFNKILSRISNQDTVKLDFSSNEIRLIAQGEYTREYNFPLKEVDEKELSVDLSEYPITINHKSVILKDIFGSSKLVADSILFDCRKTGIDLVAQGLYGRYKTTINSSSKEEFRAKFSSSHLYNMIKTCESQSNVVIKVSPKQPFFLSYKSGDNSLKYYLAHMFV